MAGDSNHAVKIAAPLVRFFEGCQLTSYPDPASGGEPYTIGWGTTKYYDGQSVRPNQTISQALADELLAGQLMADWHVLDREITRWRDLLPQQQAALLSFSYNLGNGWYGSEGFETITRCVNEWRLSDVPSSLMRYRNPGQNVEVGLGRRRRAEGLVWQGIGPEAAAKQASCDICVPADCERWQKQLIPAKPIPSKPAWPSGMVGPQRRPDLKPGDHHLIANDVAETITAYTHDGKRLWQAPCLCRGHGKEAEWSRTGEDTPPGLYLAGKVYRDYEEDPSETFSEERRAYGWYSIDLIGQEGQEGPNSSPYRDGIMIHGGGTACGFPGAWKPRQPLHPTLGCPRMHNADLRDLLVPLLALGRVWVSVLQEAKND
jgi:GH24 family phage-related lysozyme (muramidase)